jgi:FeS assembly SUF system protein
VDDQTKFVPLGMSKLTGASSETVAPEPSPSGSLEDRVIAALRTCFDPELSVNIYELGLIYDLDVESSGAVHILMTLTSPGCPVADTLVREVRSKVAAVPGVTSVEVELVWEPPWDRSRMSEAAQLELGLL